MNHGDLSICLHDDGDHIMAPIIDLTGYTPYLSSQRDNVLQPDFYAPWRTFHCGDDGQSKID
jgi:hypothetical protein